MSTYIPKIRGFDGKNGFTGDTGHILDWQIGFEDPPMLYFNFLGISITNEQKARANTLKEVRGHFPGATDCNSAKAGIEKLNSNIVGAQNQINSGDKRVAPRYVEAFNTILKEYITYFNNNCINQSPLPTTPAAVLPPPAGDPVLQSASPSGANATAPDAKTSLVINPPAASDAKETDVLGKLKKVPSWAWWAIGGLVAVTATVVIIKSKKG